MIRPTMTVLEEVKRKLPARTWRYNFNPLHRLWAPQCVTDRQTDGQQTNGQTDRRYYGSYTV